jgi:hypothetical protein
MRVLWKQLVTNWLRQQPKFGFGEPDRPVEMLPVQTLIDLLDRRINIEALGSLLESLKRTRLTVPLSRTALGLDANIFLRIPNHRNAADIIDYLDAHEAPLVIPGQAIQEFWNNQLQTVETIAKGVKKKFDALKLELDKIDQDVSTFADDFQGVMEKFALEHGYIYGPNTLKRTEAFLQMLQQKAISEYVPRTAFNNIAQQRKITKTPPGFKDDGYGDFFVWADFLYALLGAWDTGSKFEKVVFVTNDVKIDWIREGQAHPILVAEVKALLDLPFEVWTLDELAKAVGEI